jgi:hypothetical protein
METRLDISPRERHINDARKITRDTDGLLV